MWCCEVFPFLVRGIFSVIVPVEINHVVDVFSFTLNRHTFSEKVPKWIWNGCGYGF